jgi:hypothetical protein
MVMFAFESLLLIFFGYKVEFIVRFVALFGLLFPLVELYIAGVVVLRVD